MLLEGSISPSFSTKRTKLRPSGCRVMAKKKWFAPSEVVAKGVAKGIKGFKRI
jgi:hypothetical protein